MRPYLEAYWDLYWDLHLGVKGDAVPQKIRKLGTASILSWLTGIQRRKSSTTITSPSVRT